MPSSRELRKGRVSASGQIYLLTFVTHGRKPRFKDLFCARLMVRTLMSSRHTETLAFVVMPDHVHWLAQLLEERELSNAVQVIKSVSAHRLNKYLGCTGKVWQDGFHDHAIRCEEDIKDVARYIVANPIRAGLVKSVRDYPHWDAAWF